MTVAAFSRTWNVVIAAPLRAVLTHGNQTLITSASAYMNAQFAGQHDMLPSPWNWLLAIGFEWTYLRGLASAGITRSRWLDGLNYSSFAAAIIGGILYCLGIYGAIPEILDKGAAFWLAVAHVAPIALVSLCAAQVHRVAQEEAAQAQTAQREADALEERERRAVEDREAKERRDQAYALELEEKRKRLDLELWAEGKRVQALAKMPTIAPGQKAFLASTKASEASAVLACSHCGTTLTTGQYGAMKRYGRCKACPATEGKA